MHGSSTSTQSPSSKSSSAQSSSAVQVPSPKNHVEVQHPPSQLMSPADPQVSVHGSPGSGGSQSPRHIRLQSSPTTRHRPRRRVCPRNSRHHSRRRHHRPCPSYTPLPRVQGSRRRRSPGRCRISSRKFHRPASAPTDHMRPRSQQSRRLPTTSNTDPLARSPRSHRHHSRPKQSQASSQLPSPRVSVTHSVSQLYAPGAPSASVHEAPTLGRMLRE